LGDCQRPVEDTKRRTYGWTDLLITSDEYVLCLPFVLAGARAESTRASPGGCMRGASEKYVVILIDIS
jgi:hypothetical protein